MRTVAAFAGLAALLSAGNASATIMELSAQGNWNEGPLFTGWIIDAVFDTAQAQETAWTDYEGAAGHMLTVPVTLSGTAQANGVTAAIDNLVLFQSPHTLVARLIGGSVGAGGGDRFNGLMAFDSGMSARMGYNYEVGSGYFALSGTPHQAWTNTIELAPQPPRLTRFAQFAAAVSPAPEPTSWILMLVGSGMVGAALRLRAAHGSDV